MKNIAKFPIIYAILAFYPFSGSAVTFADALAHAYNNNPELIAKREEKKSVDEYMSQAISGFLPTISYGLDTTQKKQDTDTVNSTIDKNGWGRQKSSTSAIKLSQNIFKGGSTIATMDYYKNAIAASKADLYLTESNVLLKSSFAYIDVVIEKKILDLAKQNVEATYKRFLVTKERYDAGLEKKSDLALTESRAADAKATAAKAHGDYEAALAKFRSEIGLDPEDLSALSFDYELPKDEQSAVAEAVLNYPELIASKESWKQSESAVTVASTSLLPSIDLNASIGRTRSKNTDYFRLVPEYDPDSVNHFKSVVVSLNVPIYQSGAEYSNIRQKKYLAAKAKSSMRTAQNETMAKASSSWNRYVALVEAFVSATEAVKTMQITLDSRKQEYDAGIASLSEVLQSQYEYFIRSEEQLKTEQELMHSKFELLRIIGSLNAKYLALPVSIYDPDVYLKDNKFKLIGF